MSYRDSYLLRHITRRGLKIHAREEHGDVKATSLVNNSRTRAMYSLERSVSVRNGNGKRKNAAPAISSKRSVHRRRSSSASRRGKRDASPSAVAPAFQLECVFVANVYPGPHFSGTTLKTHVIG